MPGPKDAFWNQEDTLILNPSYFAPYAFRLFAQVDPTHNWAGLIDSGYRALEESSKISKVGLPSDWIVLNPKTGSFQPLPATHQLKSLYGFDAYRVWWRLALDAAWFQEPRAKQYLQQNIQHLQKLWQTQKKIPAQITLEGQPAVAYEATPQYAMLYAAFRLIDPKTAEQIYQQKLTPRYRNGFWDSDSAYYTQNLAWFALLPPASLKPLLPNTPNP
jgi:endoglucanase